MSWHLPGGCCPVNYCRNLNPHKPYSRACITQSPYGSVNRESVSRNTSQPIQLNISYGYLPQPQGIIVQTPYGVHVMASQPQIMYGSRLFPPF
jgi:hypothetical protein